MGARIHRKYVVDYYVCKVPLHHKTKVDLASMVVDIKQVESRIRVILYYKFCLCVGIRIKNDRTVMGLAHLIMGIPIPGLYSRTDVLPKDIVKFRSRKILV